MTDDARLARLSDLARKVPCWAQIEAGGRYSLVVAIDCEAGESSMVQMVGADGSQWTLLDTCGDLTALESAMRTLGNEPATNEHPKPSFSAVLDDIREEFQREGVEVSSERFEQARVDIPQWAVELAETWGARATKAIAEHGDYHYAGGLDRCASELVAAAKGSQ
jgi:hypothetical protein